MGYKTNFFVFHPMLMKLGEIVVYMDNYNFTKFLKIWWKTKKVLLIACFSVKNFKVSVESWKSYIVLLWHYPMTSNLSDVSSDKIFQL